MKIEDRLRVAEAVMSDVKWEIKYWGDKPYIDFNPKHDSAHREALLNFFTMSNYDGVQAGKLFNARYDDKIVSTLESLALELIDGP